MKTIDVYEHGRLLIDETNFKKKHWDAFVKLNTVHNGAYFDVLNNGIKFKQFVGVIQVEGLSVNIHPKADKEDSNARWKNVLLQMLKACGRIKADTADTAQLKKQNINLLEVYFEYFLKELEGIIHQGLIKKYRRETSNVKALKGKIDFAGNIRHNLIHKERFYTKHQVYDVNHKLHQVLAYALEIVGQFTKGTRLNDLTRRVSLSFPEVSTIQPTIQLISSIKIDRKTKPYERVLELAKLIILNYSPDINLGQQKMIALLFDMNQLWEEFVLRQIQKYTRDNPELGITVNGQESKRFYGENRYIIPDIVLRKNEEIIIIDTKWKLPNNNAASIEDLRQMYTYGRFWNARQLILLYPGDFDSGEFNVYPNINDPELKHQCKVSKVHVLDKEGKLNLMIGEKIIELLVLN